MLYELAGLLYEKLFYLSVSLNLCFTIPILMVSCTFF